MAHADALTEHLAWWGLRRFGSDCDYFRWQRESIPAADLVELTRLAEAKRAVPADPAAERAFYDFAARSHVLPSLYSQRYDYYLAVGPLVDDRIGPSSAVLDFGCGVGILTTFYASRYPAKSFVGVDRSEASIAVATAHAANLGLSNVRFLRLDIEEESPAGEYDLIIATHALVQAEQEPGLPSRDWTTFERARDAAAQAGFEQRTGVGARLDGLRSVLAPQGRMLIFEKTRQLARRVPFQRALASRGLGLLEPPVPVRYQLVEEIAEDGPLYHAGLRSPAAVPWDEQPERSHGEELHRCRGGLAQAIYDRLPDRAVAGTFELRDQLTGRLAVEWGSAGGGLRYLATGSGVEGHEHAIVTWPQQGESGMVARLLTELEHAQRDTEKVRSLLQALWSQPVEAADPAHVPLYENRSPAAQEAWAALPSRQVARHATLRGPDGRLTHLELGRAPGVSYFYLANNFDQRQLVVMDRQRASLLDEYYDELVTEARSSGATRVPTP